MLTIPLHRSLFTTTGVIVARTDDFTVTASTYSTGIESLTIEGSRGHVEVLPFMGQIVWDAVFDGVSLRMDSMFREPVPAKEITQTYGCFAFHSGLLAAGCPSAQDDHPLHGEFSCAEMQEAWLELEDGRIRVVSRYEYVMGFGHHYEARPHIEMRAGEPRFDIGLTVTNLSAYAPMPLQYMRHMNYAFVPGGRMRQTLPEGTFQLRRTVPAHVHPTEEWTALNEAILAGRFDADSLEGAEAFDPEIVYFADDLPQYGEDLEFTLEAPEGPTFVTRFASSQFPVATRWILHNPDQRVAAFVLPGTSRPEGRLAAREAGTLIDLAAGETRTFLVTTGIKEN